MESTPEIESDVFNALVGSARYPGMAELGYGCLGYKIPGYNQSMDFVDEWPLMQALGRLEGKRQIEIVQDKNHAIVYIPRFLLITTNENKMQADRLRLMPYSDYLETSEWWMKRKLVRLRDENACTMCGLCIDVREMHVHHKTYERRGIERLSDLETLCSHCHYNAHRWELEEA